MLRIRIADISLVLNQRRVAKQVDNNERIKLFLQLELERRKEREREKRKRDIMCYIV